MIAFIPREFFPTGSNWRFFIEDQKIEWQQVFSGLQDSSEYSNRY